MPKFVSYILTYSRYHNTFTNPSLSLKYGLIRNSYKAELERQNKCKKSKSGKQMYHVYNQTWDSINSDKKSQTIETFLISIYFS